MKSRKKRAKCKTCSSKLLIWSTTKQGKKRYYCSLCKTTRLYREKKINRSLFLLFKQYVLNGVTYEILSEYSGYSIRHLTRIVHLFLEEEPPSLFLSPSPLSAFPCLLIDGLWFGRWFVLMVYRQSKRLTILRVSTAAREVSSKIKKDLTYLVTIGYRFAAVVSDGGTGIEAAVSTVLRFTPHQICMAHMHRQIISAIRQKPKDYRVKELKELADHIFLIESKEALQWWKDKLRLWKDNNHTFLVEYKWDNTGKIWYVHQGVRKALRIMEELPYRSFRFLDHPLIPKTTNEIEAQFGHLYQRWLIHRGLKKERWEKFLKWFVYFYNEKKLSQKKS